jgi:hypothetical protein
MVTQVLDGDPESDVGCLRGEPAGPGMDQDLAGIVNLLASAVKDVGVRQADIARAIR